MIHHIKVVAAVPDQDVRTRIPGEHVITGAAKRVGDGGVPGHRAGREVDAIGHAPGERAILNAHRRGLDAGCRKGVREGGAAVDGDRRAGAAVAPGDADIRRSADGQCHLDEAALRNGRRVGQEVHIGEKNVGLIVRVAGHKKFPA